MERLTVNLPDALCGAGLLLVGAGLWCIWAPLALLAAGGTMTAAGVRLHRERQVTQARQRAANERG